MKFDGKKFAREIEADLENKVRNLAKKPRIVSVLVGNPTNPSGQADRAHSTNSGRASELYTKLKKQAAERVGIQFEILKLDNLKSQISNLKLEVEKIGKREDVDGVMVQLPIPGLSKEETDEVINTIPLEKDVDGMRYRESGVTPATVKAVLSILERLQGSELPKSSEPMWKQKFVVVGARGAVGRPLVLELRKRNVKVLEVEWDTDRPEEIVRQGDVVISCVGKEGVVTGDMVNDGVIVIDVGISESIQNSEFRIQKQNINSKLKIKNFSRVVGDMTGEVYEKATVSVEVPGGVGPVTIACLMENVLEIFK